MHSGIISGEKKFMLLTNHAERAIVEHNHR
jgi:hypothetical protein